MTAGSGCRVSSTSGLHLSQPALAVCCYSWEERPTPRPPATAGTKGSAPIPFSSRSPGARARSLLYGELGFSFPRLYLACGVPSIRTTSSIEPYTDLSLKKLIDEGRMPGTKMPITGPYLEGVDGARMRCETKNILEGRRCAAAESGPSE